MTANVLYLHGFASSPGSKKANTFGDMLKSANYDVNYVIPDLNVPDFEHLMLTDMVEKVAETVRDLPDGDVYLIGSSMGGLTTIHFLDRKTEANRVKKALLLAPAFNFMANRNRQDQHMLAQWREQGHMNFFNYAAGGEKPVHYGLIEDVKGYDSYNINVDIPIMIYHGKHDDSVDYAQSVRFAENRPNVELHLVDSDHQLLDQTDTIFEAMVTFFKLAQ